MPTFVNLTWRANMVQVTIKKTDTETECAVRLQNMQFFILMPYRMIGY